MIFRYVHFDGDFNSPTCPDVPGGEVKIFVPTIGLRRHIVAFDLIRHDLMFFCFAELWSPLCAWEKKMVK